MTAHRTDYRTARRCASEILGVDTDRVDFGHGAARYALHVGTVFLARDFGETYWVEIAAVKGQRYTTTDGEKFTVLDYDEVSYARKVSR